MFFHPTLDEFSKEAQAKKVQIETLKIIAKNNHNSGLNNLHNAFQDFASQMCPYFRETCKVSGLNNLYFSIEDENGWDYGVTYYSDDRLEFILAYDTQHFITLEYQDSHISVTEKRTTGDADINRLTKHFQNPTFMSKITDKLLECIQ